MLLQPRLVKAQEDKPKPLTRLLKSSAPDCSASVLVDIFSFFCQVPGVAPVAAVGPEFHGSAGGGDLVLGSGEGGAFGGVFALAADWAFGGVVHREPSGNPHHLLSACFRQNLSWQFFETTHNSLTAQ